MFVFLLFNNAAPQENTKSNLYYHRIVGGTPARIADYPFIAALLLNRNHFCGAAILSSKYLLTAAHCTHRLLPRELKVRVGSSYHKLGGQIHSVVKIHQHPLYTERIVDYDISILELTTDITNTKVRTIKPANKTPAAGSMAEVIGWGTKQRVFARRRERTFANKVRAVKVPIVAHSLCRLAYYPEPITDNMLCAGYLGYGRKDACQGDSGGPLVVADQLVGVVSWGLGCADGRYPGVYADVAVLQAFIRSVISN